jgi:hypothetical protein
LNSLSLRERGLAVAVFLGLSALPASAQSYPPAVLRELEQLRSGCEGAFRAKPGAIYSQDLDRDGVPEWIIDGSALECDGRSEDYCGSGGCSYDVFVRRGGEYRHAGSVLAGSRRGVRIPQN